MAPDAQAEAQSSPSPAKMETRDLTVRYGKAVAIDNITVSIAEKRVTALIGPSGCGKSTFLRSLNRMNEVIDGVKITGSVFLEGQDIYARQVDAVEVRRRVGMVFQKSNPFPKSIFENVAFGLRIAGERRKSTLVQRVEESLRAAALWEEVKDRLETSALGLSGGQQQRLCIARALAVKPEVLLMDEPASALDPIATAHIEELAELQRRIVAMGTRCEELIEMASRALIERDTTLAHDVAEADAQIDKDEMEIDDLTVRILALRQPAARDLRFLVFALKVVTDLERIGDEAANMAERAEQLTAQGFPVSDLQGKIQAMAALTKELVHQALDAFVKGDEALARGVRARDDEVDALYGEVMRGCLAYIEAHPEQVPGAMCLASTSKYLERIADHATNIAEMVVFVTSGEDVRHPFKR